MSKKVRTQCDGCGAYGTDVDLRELTPLSSVLPTDAGAFVNMGVPIGPMGAIDDPNAGWSTIVVVPNSATVMPNVTQRDLCPRCITDPTTIARVVSGKKRPVRNAPVTTLRPR